MRHWYEGFIGLRYLRASPKRGSLSLIAGIAIAGLALGVAVLIVVLSVLGGLWVFLERTPQGRDLYAIGGNNDAAFLGGVSVQRGLVIAFVLSGLLSAISGVLVASRGHRWGGMSAKYDAPVDDGTAADRQDSAEDAERARLRADASLWSALDRGDDPTNHNG